MFGGLSGIEENNFSKIFLPFNDELLEILAQTRNPLAVQPHLRKCFDAIAKLEFGVQAPQSADGKATPEGNYLTFNFFVSLGFLG